MGLTSSLNVVILLIFLERIAKGIRSPAKSSIVSVVSADYNQGKIFGMIEVFDEIGAMLGPLLLSVILYRGGDYYAGFQFMWLLYAFVVLMQIVLVRTFKGEFNFRHSERLALNHQNSLDMGFWIFVATISSSFALTFPIAITLVASQSYILVWQLPLIYLVVHVFSAFIFGSLHLPSSNKLPLLVFVLSPATFVLFLSSSFTASIFVATIYGIILGIHESTIRAIIAEFSHVSNRETAFGIYNLAMALASMLANVLFGLLLAFSGVVPAVLLVMLAFQMALGAVYLNQFFSKKEKSN